MYGLTQAEMIDRKELKHHLYTFGYAILTITQILWKTTDSPITFTLVVDNYVVKYVINKYYQYLI